MYCAGSTCWGARQSTALGGLPLALWFVLVSGSFDGDLPYGGRVAGLPPASPRCLLDSSEVAVSCCCLVAVCVSWLVAMGALQGAVSFRGTSCSAFDAQPASGTGACDMHAVAVGMPNDRSGFCLVAWIVSKFCFHFLRGFVTR